MKKFCETNSPVKMLWCSMKCGKTFRSGAFESNAADATEPRNGFGVNAFSPSDELEGGLGG